ncbi:hypothetical protein AMECASPLE_022197 [Ameca splendens]|uniref:Uncharacterized protein n=1 Tax=Ameca splendens TaxID=208324 RepID=A0ABV0YR30_9TELE
MPPSCSPRTLPGHDSQQSSTPPSTPNHPASASSPSPPLHERETCTSWVTGPGRPTGPGLAQLTSRPSAGTRHAPPPHPPDRQPQLGTQPGATATEGSIEGRPPRHAKDRAPGQPHTQTPEMPGHPHSRTVHSASPSRPTSQLLRQSEDTL